MHAHGRIHHRGSSVAFRLIQVRREGKARAHTLSSFLLRLQIGSSAFTLQRTLHDRQEARTGVAKIRRLVGEEEPEEEDEEGQEGPKYVRGMLKLELSDGFRTVKVSVSVLLFLGGWLCIVGADWGWWRWWELAGDRIQKDLVAEVGRDEVGKQGS